jgi:hypothetical protein
LPGDPADSDAADVKERLVALSQWDTHSDGKVIVSRSLPASQACLHYSSRK